MLLELLSSSESGSVGSGSLSEMILCTLCVIQSGVASTGGDPAPTRPTRELEFSASKASGSAPGDGSGAVETVSPRDFAGLVETVSEDSAGVAINALVSAGRSMVSSLAEFSRLSEATGDFVSL